MKVADLHALLGIKQDKRSFKTAEKGLTKFSQRANKIVRKGSKLRSNLGLGGGLLGGAALVQGGRNARDFSEALVRLDVASSGALGSFDDLRRKILSVSSATGIAKSQVLSGVATFVELTGEGAMASEQMELFAKVAQATGSNMDDVAASAAAMAQNMGITGAEFEKAFSILIKGGKEGAVELKDMSQLLAGLAPKAEQFAGGGGVSGLANLGAALQLTRRGFGSASEAANGLERLMGSLIKNSSRFKGVNMFDVDENGVKTARSLQAIIGEISDSDIAKDPTLLARALGSKEAASSFIQLTKVRGEWSKLSAATVNATDVAEDYGKVSNSAAIKSTKAWNKVTNAANSFFNKSVEGLGLMIDLMGGLKSPLKEIGTTLDGLVASALSVESDFDEALNKQRNENILGEFNARLGIAKFQAKQRAREQAGGTDAEFLALARASLGTGRPTLSPVQAGTDFSAFGGAQGGASPQFSNNLVVNVEAGANVDGEAIKSIDRNNRAALDALARQAAVEGS